MKKENLNLIFLFSRYILLALLALGSLWIFYFIFTPLTVYPVYYILKILFNSSLVSTLYQDSYVPAIIFNTYSITLIPACIAGAAYYLLLILNLTTPMPVSTRIKSILFSLFSFLIINIIRIVFFSLLLITSFSLFNTLHLIFWYFLSSLIVFAVWILEIKLFKITSIPVYTDIKQLIKLIKNV